MDPTSIQASHSTFAPHPLPHQREKQNAAISSAVALPILLIGGLFAVTKTFIAQTSQTIAWTPVAYTTGASITVAGAGLASLCIVITAVALGALFYFATTFVRRAFL